MIQVGILGARGRMGKRVVLLLESEFSKTAKIVAQVDKGDEVKGLLKADVIIDFSTPQGMQGFAEAALKETSRLPAFVTGTTGWTAEEGNLLKLLSQKTPVLNAANFSPGIFILGEILEQFAPLLKKLDYTPVLVDTHHRHKKDSPSGTTLHFQKILAPKHPEQVQTHSIRAGEVIADSEIIFYGPNESIKLAHHAQDRDLFAKGAIEVALWLGKEKVRKPELSGLFQMEDYFNSVR